MSLIKFQDNASATLANSFWCIDDISNINTIRLVSNFTIRFAGELLSSLWNL